MPSNRTHSERRTRARQIRYSTPIGKPLNANQIWEYIIKKHPDTTLTMKGLGKIIQNSLVKRMGVFEKVDSETRLSNGSQKVKYEVMIWVRIS